MTRYILDGAGEPIPCDDLLQWGRWLVTHDRTLARDRDESGRTPVLVSTVFLGLDHQFGAGPPILWETMIFGRSGAELYCERYATRADALAGHQRACTRAAALAAGAPVTD